MKVNKEIKSNSMKKNRKNNQKSESIIKVEVECFGYNNLLQDLKLMKIVVK